MVWILMSSEWKKHAIEEKKFATTLGYQIGTINTHVKPLTYSIEKPTNRESELTQIEFEQIKILEGKNTKTVPMHFVELTEEIERAAVATYISKEYPVYKKKHRADTIVIFNNGALELINGIYNRESSQKWQELIDDIDSDKESDDDESDDDELEPSIKPPIKELKNKHNEQKMEIGNYLRTQKNMKTIVFLDKRAKKLSETNPSTDCKISDYSTQPDAPVEYEKKHFYSKKKEIVGPMPDPIPFPWFEGLDGDIRVICLETEWIKNIDEFLSPLMKKEKIGLPFVYFGIDKFCYVKKDDDEKIVLNWTNFDYSGPEWFSVVNQFLAAVTDINSFFIPSR